MFFAPVFRRLRRKIREKVEDFSHHFDRSIVPVLRPPLQRLRRFLRQLDHKIFPPPKLRHGLVYNYPVLRTRSRYSPPPPSDEDMWALLFCITCPAVVSIFPAFIHWNYPYALAMLEFAPYFIYTFLGLMCLLAQSAVSAVLYMIALFVLTALCYVAAGAEFLGILLIIVYVGAVAVLFLFVVMILNQGRPEDFQARSQRLEFLVVPIAAALVAFLCRIAGSMFPFAAIAAGEHQDWLSLWLSKTNAEALGSTFYTQYAHIFVSLAVILPVAMVASIALTLGAGSRRSARSQDKFTQLDRDLIETVRLHPTRPRKRSGSTPPTVTG